MLTWFFPMLLGAFLVAWIYDRWRENRDATLQARKIQEAHAREQDEFWDLMEEFDDDYT